MLIGVSALADTRFALRRLHRDLGWTSAAVLTLALGISTNTAMFSVMRALVLRPFDYPAVDRVVLISRAQRGSDLFVSAQQPAIEAWRKSAHSFETIETYRPNDATLSTDVDAIALHGVTVSGGFFRLARPAMLAGRGLSDADTKSGAPPVVVISEGLWRQRFAASPSILGTHVVIDDVARTIVGVAPATLRVPLGPPSPTDVWLPLTADLQIFGGNAVGRMRAGVSLEAATAELDSVLVRTEPGRGPIGARFDARLMPVGENVPFKRAMYLTWCAVVVLLVLACANVAHLLLARGAAREREFAVRSALGASRRRLAQQLAVEGALLTALGCALGVGLAALAVRFLVASRPHRLPQLAFVRIDATVLGAAVFASFVTGMISTLVGGSGLMSESHLVRLSGGSASGGRRRHRIHSGLLFSEVALSAVLVLCTTLLVRSAINLQRIDTGFVTRDLSSLAITPSSTRYTTADARRALTDRILDRVRQLPGVTAATIAKVAPPDVSSYYGGLVADGDSVAAGAVADLTEMNSVQPDYFSVLGIPLRSGRFFDATSAARNDAIVGAGMAKRLFRGNAVGRRFRLTNPFAGKDQAQRWWTVIGVAGDVVTAGMAGTFHDPLIYLPRGAVGATAGEVIVIRSATNAALAEQLRLTARAVDPTAVVAVSRIERAVGDATAPEHFAAALLSMFAVVAVALSAVGLYGIVAYMVAQRTREFGVRIALGASPALIGRSVLSDGLRLALPAAAFGLMASAVAARMLRSMLYDVQPSDATSYILSLVLLIIVTVLACLHPVLRAMRVDPIASLRVD